jgi:hypothetical protein
VTTKNKSKKERDPVVDDAFKQLDGALCIWARAKGEQPQKAYFHEVNPYMRRLLLGDQIFEVTIVPADDDNPT